MAEGVWKSGFSSRLKIAIRYFKKSYSVSEDSQHLDDFEARWISKAISETEKRILRREIKKLKDENNK